MQPNYQAFWDFFSEMERMRCRREAGGKPPHTDDPVMAHFYFPNIFPRDDVANVYYFDRASEHQPTAVWQAHVYRLMNRSDTFDLAKAQLGQEFPAPTLEGLAQWVEWLEDLRLRGEKIFTHLHHVRGYRAYVESLEYLLPRLEVVTERLRVTLPKAVDVLRETPSVGSYFGWQISCYLVEVGVIIDDPEWALLGPGAIRGARCVDPAAQPDYTIRELRAVQGEVDQSFFSRAPVTLRDLENALCEYARYTNARGLEARPRRGVRQEPWWKWY